MEVKVIYGDTVLAEVPLSGAVTDKISRATEALRWVERASNTIGAVRIVGWSGEFRCIVSVSGPVLSWRYIEGEESKDAISAIESVRDLIESGCPDIQNEYPVGEGEGEWLPDRVINGVNVDAARRVAVKVGVIDAFQRIFHMVENYPNDTKMVLRYIREEIAKHEGE